MLVEIKTKGPHNTGSYYPPLKALLRTGKQPAHQILAPLNSTQDESEDLRQTDFVGRYGGEEFVVILPETTLENALPIAENLRKVIEATPVIFERDELIIHASIGVADFRPDKQKKFEDIFKLSDDALYYSKENGRNCVTFIDGDQPCIYKK